MEIPRELVKKIEAMPIPRPGSLVVVTFTQDVVHSLEAAGRSLQEAISDLSQFLGSAGWARQCAVMWAPEGMTVDKIPPEALEQLLLEHPSMHEVVRKVHAQLPPTVRT